jgi:thymidylate synthase (FAD)
LKGIKVELLDYMGNDLDVVNAARVSFSKTSEFVDEEGILGVAPADYVPPRKVLSQEDTKLIKYLATHSHWTPFSHTALKFRVAAPVPIRTQCFKHKIGLTENEESRRYISTTPEIFVPEFFRAKPEGSIKQGSGDVHNLSDTWLEVYQDMTTDAVNAYLQMLEDGICPEQARFILPQSAIVNWIWTGNLVSFANFYNKRTDPTAQKEVKYLAEQLGALVKDLFPVSWEALTNKDNSK